jgi:hypothetical protein
MPNRIMRTSADPGGTPERWHPTAATVGTETGHRALEPVPAPPPFDIADAAAVARHIKKSFRAGHTLRRIADELTRLGAEAPNGTNKWTGANVKHVMLTAPCEMVPRQRLRKAA